MSGRERDILDRVAELFPEGGWSAVGRSWLRCVVGREVTMIPADIGAEAVAERARQYMAEHGAIPPQVAQQRAASLVESVLEPVAKPDTRYRVLAIELADLVTAKQKQYGRSADRSGAILRVLYPDGVPVHAYDDALLVVRCLDKLSRIAQRGADGRDLGGESPWRDLMGYSLLGLAKDEEAGG